MTVSLQHHTKFELFILNVVVVVIVVVVIENSIKDELLVSLLPEISFYKFISAKPDAFE